MAKDYDTIQLVKDANAFAESKFGEHYLKRLHGSRERALKDTMRQDLTDSQRAHAGTRADQIQAEIDYFDTARAVQDDPSLLERIREKLSLKKKTEPPAV